MIYPTRRAIVVALLGAPVTLAAGALAPGLWLIGAAWIALVGGMVLLDAALGADRASLSLDVVTPPSLPIGGAGSAELKARFGRGMAPRMAEAALETNDRLRVAPALAQAPVSGKAFEAVFHLTPERRGEGLLARLWVRWTGPLGLVWKQRSDAANRVTPILPNLPAVREEAMRLFSRDAPFGVKSQLDTGEGSEFHALQDYQVGMDRRRIDWRRSARHRALLAKEFRTERNHHVIVALDCGRLMSEPVQGLPRIDRAINAALLLAFVSLKTGDRVGLFSFDSRPRISTGVVSGTASFPLLQRLAAGVDYSAEETNFTLALTQLSGELERRSLIVVFTDFADSTSAELMIENLGRLLKRHVVVFMVFRDEELESLMAAEPQTPDDVSRAVIAHTLAREREVVIERLRRMGAHIVDAPLDRLGPALLASYFDLKRREVL
jgi:uncharacterized protein (DUF58 family)